MNVVTMTPDSAARDSQVSYAFGESSLGSILVAAKGKGVCAIFLGDDRASLLRILQDRFPRTHLIEGRDDVKDLAARVVGFVEKPAAGLDVPLDLEGTAFQQRVWQALREIPLGETASYSEIARQIGAPGSARAVARACAANEVALAVPCHRAIGAGGALSGYRWGTGRKRVLLERETSFRRRFASY